MGWGGGGTSEGGGWGFEGGEEWGGGGIAVEGRNVCVLYVWCSVMVIAFGAEGVCLWVSLLFFYFFICFLRRDKNELKRITL